MFGGMSFRSYADSGAATRKVSITLTS
jgi:hypothetical protein